MFSKVYAWVKGLAEVATIIQLLGSLGGATVAAILFPALLQSALGLPLLLRVVLGFSVFFVALAVILAILKALLERSTLANKPSQQVISERDQLRADIREQERERQQLVTTADQRKAEIERLEELNQQLVTDKDALMAEVELLSTWQDRQLTDEELKQRYLERSQQLFQFADQRDDIAPQKNPGQNPGWWNRATKETAHDEETANLYGRQFAGRIRADLEAAEQRGWITPEERKVLEGKLKGSGTYRKLTPHFREVAQRLEALGHKM